MAKAGDPNRVPAAMLWVYQSIGDLTDEFSASPLNDEYAALARRMAAALARKRPSPLWSGDLEMWACGILYALGKINFLFDKAQAPHVRAEDLCSYFGVAASTGSAKAKVVLDHLRIRGHDPNWTLPSRLANHPFIWLVSVNGLIVDIRHMPEEVPEAAYHRTRPAALRPAGAHSPRKYSSTPRRCPGRSDLHRLGGNLAILRRGVVHSFTRLHISGTSCSLHIIASFNASFVCP
jgi:hypothetical protein